MDGRLEDWQSGHAAPALPSTPPDRPAAWPAGPAGRLAGRDPSFARAEAPPAHADPFGVDARDPFVLGGREPGGTREPAREAATGRGVPYAPGHPSWPTGLAVENPNAPSRPQPPRQASAYSPPGVPSAPPGGRPASGPPFASQPRDGGPAGRFPAEPPARPRGWDVSASGRGDGPGGGSPRPGGPIVFGGADDGRRVGAGPGMSVDGGPGAGRGPGPGSAAGLGNGATRGNGAGAGHGHGAGLVHGSGPGQGAGMGQAGGIAVGGDAGSSVRPQPPAGPWVVEGSADRTGRPPASPGRDRAGAGAGYPGPGERPAPAGLPTQAFDPLFDDFPVGQAPVGLYGAGRGTTAGGPGGGAPGVQPGIPGVPSGRPGPPSPHGPGQGYPPRPPAAPGAPVGSPASVPGAPVAFAPLHDQAPDFQPSTQFPAPAPSPLPQPPPPPPGMAPGAQPPPNAAAGLAAPPRPPSAPYPGADGGRRRPPPGAAPAGHEPSGYPETARGMAPPQPGLGRVQPGQRESWDQFDVGAPRRPGAAPVDNRGGRPIRDGREVRGGHEVRDGREAREGREARDDIGAPYSPPRRRNTSDGSGNVGGPADDVSNRAGVRHNTGHPGAALYSDALLGPAQETAARGWRKVVYQMSGGAVNPGPSPDEARHNRLLAHIRTSLIDCHRIAVMSLKGGVGKTTTTIGLGSTLADLRDDRVVAIDANPDRGTLGTKVQRPSPYTVRDLLEHAPGLHRYVDIRQYMARSDSRLDVLASADDPEISEAFADSDYRAVDNLLQRYYSILLTDCGTGMLHSAMGGVLGLADTLVIVTSSSADGGTSASATLDWLDAHGYADRVRDAIAVISMFPSNGDGVDVESLEQHFAARTRRVVRVPWDPHLATGGRIDLQELKRETRRAYQELAAAVAERFAPPDLDDAGYPVPQPRHNDRLFS
ncbi:MinD/ParA family ATP-binding protein [Pseudofrankia asymbiotica]|uniref:CobQ/CobB/MinD/ParA nucleotide binding domain-containing protein n=1 Tax=Pseudofrankia asymbiotica TaxID=1834516 RepID=A0A1V2IC31_9ACTN|nr:MinD/ParA family protein [Pseudofrankia asymbiotica]ONH30724.1 hypothetical protein BL253_12490 [Pseudofrankia asymbiotica]